jgi:hypothetical protein
MGYDGYGTTSFVFFFFCAITSTASSNGKTYR